MDESVQKLLERPLTITDRKALGLTALLAIERHMATIPEESVQMSSWCGTSQCPMGHCIRLPEVQATGLYYQFDVMHGNYFPAFDGAPMEGNMSVVIGKALGLTERQADTLFINNGTKAEFMKSIRRFLRRRGV